MSNQEIIEEAKAIMDSFMKAMDKVNVSDDNFGTHREKSKRIPSESDFDNSFKQKMLKNAPKKDQDCIIADKKSW